MEPGKPDKVQVNADPLTEEQPLHTGRTSLEVLASKLNRRSKLSRIYSSGAYRTGALTHLIKQAWYKEVENGISFNLTPVFLSVGILLYFIAPAEPSFYAILLGAMIASIIWLKTNSRGVFFHLIMIFALVFAGMLVSKLSILTDATPIIERQMTGKLSGIVIRVDSNRRGSPRVLLKPSQIEGLVKEQLPLLVRVSIANRDIEVEPGYEISGLARLQPVAGPIQKGSYDFSFYAWFNGIGGSGFFMGKPDITNSSSVETTIGEDAQIWINTARRSIETRINHAVAGPTSGIIVALITGNKTMIKEDDQQALRDTGLAHILAISGLHMALITFTIISLVRVCLSFFPTLVLHYPVKKWAAAAGFLVATQYLFLSGAGVATQRAWIMISVMLCAVVLDRNAITMRSVVISATIILCIDPHSLFAPGFQMSFAAVAALVAGYEIYRDRRTAKLAQQRSIPGSSILSRGYHVTKTYIGGILLTSLLAGTATAFVAAWHFHQMATLGLAANLLAMPIVSLLVMPAIVLSMVLMPFGFESVGFMLVSLGIEWVLHIAKWLQEIAPAAITGKLPQVSIGLFAVALAGCTILKSRLRWLSPLLLVPAMFLTPNQQSNPDILVSENGRAIAVKTDTDDYTLLYPRRNPFVTNIWAKALKIAEYRAHNLSETQCSRDQCTYQLSSGKVLQIVYDPDLLKSACNSADILIAPRLWWVNCRSKKPDLILKRHDFEQRGAHTIFLNRIGSEPGKTPIHIETALSDYSRPWHRDVKPKP